MIDLLKKDGDLLLSQASSDFQQQSSRKEAVLSQVIESFDMPFADDIDFPFLHSRQRQAHNAPEDAQGLSSLAARMVDAERILIQHPDIAPESIDVSVSSDKTPIIDFTLKNGSRLQGVRI